MRCGPGAFEKCMRANASLLPHNYDAVTLQAYGIIGVSKTGNWPIDPLSARPGGMNHQQSKTKLAFAVTFLIYFRPWRDAKGEASQDIRSREFWLMYVQDRIIQSRFDVSWSTLPNYHTGTCIIDRTGTRYPETCVGFVAPGETRMQRQVVAAL